MNILNKNKKGQGLPLQTIVIAILVIIVLLVIVLFFVTKMGDAGSGVDDASAGFTECKMGAFGTDIFDDVKPLVECEAKGTNAYSTRIYTIPKDTDGNVCCGKPKTKAE